MELLDKQMHMLFPTAPFTEKISDYSLCERLDKKLVEMRKAGQGGRDEDGVYVTPDDIHLLPEFKKLSTLVLAEANEILNVHRIRRDSHYITNMWANITHPNHRHHMHIHPNCVLSGIFYVRMP